MNNKSKPINSFQQYQQIIDRINARVEREANQQRIDRVSAALAHNVWIFDNNLPIRRMCDILQ